MSPNNNKSKITASCSFAKPLKISRGVNIPKNPKVTTAITNAKVAPIISLYRNIRINRITIKTTIRSNVIIK